MYLPHQDPIMTKRTNKTEDPTSNSSSLKLLAEVLHFSWWNIRDTPLSYDYSEQSMPPLF